jgi:serine protease Do
MQDLESFFAVDIDKGVLVNSVDRNSAASKAGVRPEDILLEVNGHHTNVRFPEELAPIRKMISDLPIGSDVELTLLRGKEVMHLTAKTLKLQGAVGEEKEFADWGLSVRDMTRAYANRAQLDDATGVVVTTLSPGYAAAKAELSPGDVIRSVNGQRVEDLDAFNKLYKDSTDKKQKTVLLQIQRGRGRQSAVLKVTNTDEN